MENQNWPIRYNAPNKFVKEPYATIVKVIKDTGYDLYIQISTDEENAEWLLIDIFLAQALENKLHEPNFLNELLRLFNERKNE